MMKALVCDGKGGASVQDVTDYPVRDTFVKIKVHAVALNPTDMKHVFHYTKGGEVVGCDTTGTVEAIGKDVKANVKVGDRIAGIVHGCNSYSPRDGGFAEKAEIKDGIFAHIPPSWSWAQAATLGGGITTAAQGLFQGLELPSPDAPAEKPIRVLIYGGSTATGCLAIQLGKLAGLEVITLASPQQHGRLRELGASECYDYHEAGVGERIRRATDDSLMYAFDILSSESSMKICADALSSKARKEANPRICLLLPGKVFPRPDVDVRLTSGYSIMGETSIKYGNLVAGNSVDYDFGKKIWLLTTKLIVEGRIKPHDIEVRSGGLEGIMQGLRDLESQSVKGVKLVYEV